MKLILAIISNDDSAKVSSALTKEMYFVTKLATTGGFLLKGNTTLMVGTQAEKVDRAIEIIMENSKRRTKIVASDAPFGAGIQTGVPVNTTVGGAAIFVTDIERFEKI